MAEQATFQRLDAPSVMLVALDAPIEAVCTSTLLDSGLRILKVREVAPACERVAVTMPKLVIGQTNLQKQEANTLLDRCVAVGAQVLWLDPTENRERMKQRIAAAAMSVLASIYG